jgi:hypothetical protein
MDELPDDLLDFESGDPIEAIIKIDRNIRPPSDFRINGSDQVEIVNRYYQIIKHSCDLFGVTFDVDSNDVSDTSDARTLLYLIQAEIEKRKIEVLHAKFQSKISIELDENWREKILSYISHVRIIVTKAEIREQIRDSIMSKLHALDAEVDRTRTRTAKITEVLVELCKGVSAGANELKPAVRLFERVVGAIANLWPSQPPNLTLPPPDTLGLPPPDEPTAEDNAN